MRSIQHPFWACQNLNFIKILLSTLIDLVTDELYTIHWGPVMLSGVPSSLWTTSPDSTCYSMTVFVVVAISLKGGHLSYCRTLSRLMDRAFALL